LSHRKIRKQERQTALHIVLVIKIMAVDHPMTLIISMHAMTLMLASITAANLMTAAVSKMNILEG